MTESIYSGSTDFIAGQVTSFGADLDSVMADDFDAPVRFHRQPRLLMAEQRVAYRLAALVLTLSRFRGGAASVAHLHVIGWAIRSRRGRNIFLAWWQGRRLVDTVTERFDPNLPVTLNLALVHGLIRFANVQGRRVRLTDEGAALAGRVESDTTLLRTEKDFLASLGGLTEAGVRRILGSAGP